MDSQGTNTTSITQEYEQKAIEEFQRWCQQHQPTLRQASTQAFLTACEVAIGLTTERVLRLLGEHPEWVFGPPSPAYWGNNSADIQELVRRHLISLLEQFLQKRGFAVVVQKR